MKRLIAILVFACLSLTAAAQDEMRVVDSLKECLTHQEGPTKVETMVELSAKLCEISYDDCIFYGEAAIEEARKLMDEDLVAWAVDKLGLQYLEHYDLDLAHDCFAQSEALMRKHEIKDGQFYLDVLNYKGRVEFFMGEMTEALSTFSKALEYSVLLEDDMNCADVINNIACVYYYQDDLDRALEYFMDARQRYLQLEDTLSVAQCDNNISNIYVHCQQYDEAKAILQKAISVFEEYDDEASLAHAYQNLGMVYAWGHLNLDSAWVYLHKSIDCAENVGDEITRIEDEMELANVLKLLDRDNEAVSLYQLALHSSEKMGYSKGMLEAYKNLGIHYNETGDFTMSAIYLKRCVDLATESGNLLYVNSVRPYLIANYAHLGRFSEMSKELGVFQANYENVINESNILDEDLARLRADAESLIQQHEIQNRQIETFKIQRNHYRLAFFGLLTLVFISVAVVLVYKNVRKNRVKTKKG